MVPLACGGKTPPPEPPPTSADDGPERPSVGAQVSSEIGGMNEEQVSRVFERASAGFTQCLTAGADRVEFLGGDVELYALIDSNGMLAHAHLATSSLGDRATEKCLLDVLRQQRWPKPVGGERGIARKSFGFEPSGEVRPPVSWNLEAIEATLASLGDDIDGCKQGQVGSFTATLYVDTEGQAIAVGMAPPDERGEAVVDCLVELLESAEYPSPGSWPAKVTFTL